MSKLIYLLCFTGILFSSCSETIKQEVIFDSDIASYYIDSPNKNTTMCTVSITGAANSDLKLSISGYNSICIQKGKVDFWRNYEWFDERNNVILTKLNNKDSKSELIIQYEFSSSYFGNNAMSGGIGCKELDKTK